MAHRANPFGTVQFNVRYTPGIVHTKVRHYELASISREFIEWVWIIQARRRATGV
jgi:hypothetical protein